MNPAIFGGRGCGGGCGPKKGPPEPSETIINIGGGDSSLGCIRDPDTCEITGKVLLIPAPAAIAFPGCPAPSPSEAKPSLFYIGTDGTCEPYDPEIHGEWGSCECQYKRVGWVADPTSPFCDQEIYACNGAKFVFNFTTCEYEKLPMGTVTTPYQPSGDKPCREAQIGPFELAPGATDNATIIADAIAAEAPNFDFNGTLVPVTADDVSSIRITPKLCETFTADGDEITADFVDINGTASSGHYDAPEGGVDATTEVEVPVGGCSIVEICFKSCLSKQEIADLG